MAKMLPLKRAKGARAGGSGGSGGVCQRQEASIGLNPIFSISCASCDGVGGH